MLTTVGGFIILFATMAAMSYLPHIFPDYPRFECHGGRIHASAYEYRVSYRFDYFGCADQQERAVTKS